MNFKILSIDGGGIKGLYALSVINEIEKKIKNPIGDYFDMIAGTSTGGIIALCLSQRILAEEIIQAYQKIGPSIFSSFITPKILKGFFKPKYSIKLLKRELVRLLGESTTLSAAQNQLIIPAFDLTNWQPKIFKSPIRHKENPWTADMEKKMVDVGLATSAAPIYFPLVKLDQTLYCDGGVSTNNPALTAYFEAVREYINPNCSESSISILSLGNPTIPQGRRGGSSLKLGVMHWAVTSPLLVESMLTGQSHSVDYFLRSLSENKPYSSIPVKYNRIISEPLSTSQCKQLALDNASKGSMELLISLGRKRGEYYVSSKFTDIDHQFKNKKSYIF